MEATEPSTLAPAGSPAEEPRVVRAPPGPAPAPRSRGLRWLAGAAVLVAAALLARATLLAPEPIAVTVAAVERGPVEETVTNSRAGTLRARRRAKLSPEIGGRVVELPFAKGDRVPAGAVILRLDDALQRANLEIAQRDLAAVEAQSRQACLGAQQARRELERNRGLAAEGMLSPELLDRLETTASTQAAACDAARRTIERSRAAVGVARAELDRTVLRAPFAATIAELSTDLGESVTPSPPGVPMPPVVDLLDPLPGRQLSGRVSRVAPYVLDVEQQNRTLEIEVELLDRALAATLLPGTSADVEVILEVRPDVLRVPTPALIEERRVLRVKGGRLEERTLEVGLRNWDFTEVRAGLAAGDQVVLSLDREGVRDGAEVVVEAPGRR